MEYPPLILQRFSMRYMDTTIPTKFQDATYSFPSCRAGNLLPLGNSMAFLKPNSQSAPAAHDAGCFDGGEDETRQRPPV